MGLTIHYKGRFNKNASLPKMISEVTDIVEACKWKYRVYEHDFPKNNDPDDSYNNSVYGISFTPPGSEPVWLCFLSNRRMSGPLQLQLWGSTTDPSEKNYVYMLFTKTQFAGEETHKFIIELFRHLQKQNYFEMLEIIDEGEYWETGDEIHLKDQFDMYRDMLDSFSFALENVPKETDESFEEYFMRLIKIIQIKKDGKNDLPEPNDEC